MKSDREKALEEIARKTGSWIRRELIRFLAVHGHDTASAERCAREIDRVLGETGGEAGKTSVAEAKEALRRLEQDLTLRLQAFENETGLKARLEVNHTDVSTAQDHAEGRNQYFVEVRASAEVEG